MYSSKYLEQLIEELVKLPSIGQKSAQRLALHLLRVPREEALRLAEAIAAVREKVGRCSLCGLFSEEDPCLIDRDPQRDPHLVCVVEQPADVLALERTGSFRGRYHVLGGVLSPLDGTRPEDLRIRELRARLGNAPIQEIIFTNTLPIDRSKILPNMRVLSVAGLLGSAIQSIHEETSVSNLFA